MHTSNTDDTSREKLRHIIGACMCKDDDKSCWYTNNAQEVENDGTVQDNQVEAIQLLINEARIDEWKLISEVTHSANLVASSYLGKARDERIKQLRSEL